MTWTAILATLMKLNLWANDKATEDPAERADRLRTAAIAISAAAANREEVAFLLTLGESESRFSKYVGEDRCHLLPKGMRCDSDPKTGIPRARSYWQLHRQSCPSLFELPANDERAVYVAASCAVALFRYGKFACSTPEGPWNLYAGLRCSSDFGKARAQRMLQVRSILEHGGPWPAMPKPSG